MPQRLIIGGVVLAIASVVIVVAIVMKRGGDDQTMRDDRATHTSANPAGGSNAVVADDDTQPHRLREINPAPKLGSGVAPVPPAEAQHDMLEAFTARRFDDVRELCGSREVATAHAYECTISACKTHSGMQARRFYIAVSDADRAKVEAECMAENVTLERPERPARPVRPHRTLRGRKGAVVDD